MAIAQRHDIVVPVLGVVLDNGTPVMREAHGTAFPIGGSLFLTADHVPQEVDAADLVLTIGAGRDGEWLAVKASIHTRWPEVDLAVLEADEPRLEPVDWTTTEVPIFEPVRTLGFPFGADQRHSTLSARGLVGHVAAGRQFPELTGTPEISRSAVFRIRRTRQCRGKSLYKTQPACIPSPGDCLGDAST